MYINWNIKRNKSTFTGLPFLPLMLTFLSYSTEGIMKTMTLIRETTPTPTHDHATLYTITPNILKLFDQFNYVM